MRLGTPTMELLVSSDVIERESENTVKDNVKFNSYDIALHYYLWAHLIL